MPHLIQHVCQVNIRFQTIQECCLCDAVNDSTGICSPNTLDKEPVPASYTIPLSVCGFDGVLSPEEAADAMRQYYSEEAEIKYGALGIELVLIAQRVTLMSDPTYNSH